MTKLQEATYLRHWLTGEGYSQPFDRPVILECICSRSGMSLNIYERDTLLFRIDGCGFDRIGTALGDFLETHFQYELARKAITRLGLYGFKRLAGYVSLDGAAGFRSMRDIAKAIGLDAQAYESKSGTLIVIRKAK